MRRRCFAAVKRLTCAGPSAHSMPAAARDVLQGKSFGDAALRPFMRLHGPRTGITKKTCTDARCCSLHGHAMQKKTAVAAACTCLLTANSSDQLRSPAILGLIAFFKLLQDSEQVNVISSINLQQEQYHCQQQTVVQLFAGCTLQCCSATAAVPQLPCTVFPMRVLRASQHTLVKETFDSALRRSCASR
jgi:hypothetical protein